jgi:hypothetical protein
MNVKIVVFWDVKQVQWISTISEEPADSIFNKIYYSQSSSYK